ncbi:hypothetical protein GGS23DRAFT_254771 [Durotheca rogersii]|uniref:uncharacterized protein n=1 Tax=Durotheca rogersii TaxID=419775 RepID=UPI002220FFB4|nr:uncharacterized protein GGS23DRAFT_254771 [Durotheca rogersii]KAI5859929.1 hypothetical protein GGS23DRAFT_254771 [Durotheca rogersii]
MSKLPPVEKLPLALRKNIRDDWDSKKPEFEQKLSKVLTVPWTIDVNPNQLYPYADSSYAKDRLGSCIADYIDSAIRRLEDFASGAGEAGLQDLNEICSAHVLTMDLDDQKRVRYCGVNVDDGGRLRILFAPGYLGTNIGDAVEKSGLLQALNAAPRPSGSALSFVARWSVRKDYEPDAEEIRGRIAATLGLPDVRLNPNFEAVFAALKAEADKGDRSELRSDWESCLGSFVKLYFDTLATRLKDQKFDQDDLLREGFQEAVDKSEIAFRIVDKLKYKSYCEVDIEDGVLYLQCTAKRWGTNIGDVAEGLIDRL